MTGSRCVHIGTPVVTTTRLVVCRTPHPSFPATSIGDTPRVTARGWMRSGGEDECRGGRPLLRQSRPIVDTRYASRLSLSSNRWVDGSGSTTGEGIWRP